jgi:hypothetical protein
MRVYRKGDDVEKEVGNPNPELFKLDLGENRKDNLNWILLKLLD